jgi:hypothetical protein
VLPAGPPACTETPLQLRGRDDEVTAPNTQAVCCDWQPRL